MSHKVYIHTAERSTVTAPPIGEWCLIPTVLRCMSSANWKAFERPGAELIGRNNNNNNNKHPSKDRGLGLGIHR